MFYHDSAMYLAGIQASVLLQGAEPALATRDGVYRSLGNKGFNICVSHIISTKTKKSQKSCEDQL